LLHYLLGRLLGFLLGLEPGIGLTGPLKRLCIGIWLVSGLGR